MSCSSSDSEFDTDSSYSTDHIFNGSGNDDAMSTDVNIRYQFEEVKPEHYEINCVHTDEEAMSKVQLMNAVIRQRLKFKLRMTDIQLNIASPYEIFKRIFLNGTISIVLQEILNERLRQLNANYCEETELYQAVTVVFAAAFYGTSVTELLDNSNENVYNSPNVDRSRIILIIRCMEGAKSEVNGSHHTYPREVGTQIDRLEEAFSAIYCSLAYVAEMNLSPDDDLVRMRSRKVPDSTNLNQINIPGKGMGCAQTTVSCPLTNIGLSLRYSAKKESYHKSLQILLRRVQMQIHDHLVDYHFLSTIFLDRGYVSEAVMQMLRKARIHLVGTQKKGNGSPFIIGGADRGLQRMNITEKGILTDFWARRKWSNGVESYHLALREERVHGGKIAMLVTTRKDLAKGNWIVKAKSAGAKQGKKYREIDLDNRKLSVVAALVGIGKQVLSAMDRKVMVLTENQSGHDKLWFLSQPLHYTSTGGLEFLRLLGKEFPVLISESETRKRLYEAIGLFVRSPDSNDESSIIPTLTRPEVDAMTVSQMKEQCKKRSIRRASAMNRSQVIEKLINWVPNSLTTLVVLWNSHSAYTYETS